MGRKKKSEKNNEAESAEAEKKPPISIASDAKRSVAAVFLFALALVILLGFLGKSGAVGELLNKATGVVFGWGKLVFPLFLIAAGVVLLFRKETSFYVSKLIGLAVTLVGLAGFFHWFFEAEKMAAAAKAGSGGGYVGYAVAYLAVQYLGAAGGLIIIAALFLSGFIVAFNFSIAHFARKTLERIREIKQVEAEGSSEAEIGGEVPLAAEEIGGDLTIVEAQSEEEKLNGDDVKNNIGKIAFVEGNDRYVDEKVVVAAEDERKKRAGQNNPGKIFEGATLRKRKNKDDNWQLPPVNILEKSSGSASGGDTDKNIEIIEKTLKHFGIEVECGETKTGPAVTQYSFRPAVGVKISRILALQNDLALALAKHPIRIEAPIPGKSLIGIEVPNAVSAVVRLRDILESSGFAARKSDLTLMLGEDVSGNYVFGNLDKMPHLMIAGATGTGKSVAINSIVTSLLYQNSPQNLKFIMVDPKRVELSLYNGIPHLLCPVIVENSKVVSALKWAVGEMERRYRLLQDMSSRDINSYNEKIKSNNKIKRTDPETGEIEEIEFEKLPYIVIIIDELADLMGAHGKEVEGAVVRLAQMARAVGIHLIVSTQRPSVEVITGLIKANITTRVAFQVATQIDSRTILDMAGAEKLLGNGDLLYLSASSPKPVRVQGVYISENEVKSVVGFIKNQKNQAAEKIGSDITRASFGGESGAALDFNAHSGNNVDEDDLYEAAKEEVVRMGKASASLLQRRLRVGYARAARLIDILEERGVVGPADGAKPREVYAAKNTPEEAINYDNPNEDQSERDKWQI